MSQRIGIGYDIHRLVKGRKLFLGGIEVPFAKGLLGHSDADVVLHALCDAMLGALGKGDIGEHFPNTDKKYKDISSLVLLKNVHRLVTSEGYQVGNVDTMLIADQPNFKLYKPKMRRAIARAIGIKEEAVNIKATTQEGLGGKKEAISAFATVLLTKV